MFIAFDGIMPRPWQSGGRAASRAATDSLTILVLSILAGAFAPWSDFATTAGAHHVSTLDGAAALSAGLPYGVVRLLTGLFFSFGLILVVIAGAELFTGNNLLVMSWAGGKVSTRALLENWAIAFVGNFIGAFMTAVLMFYTTQYTFGAGAVGLVALNTAHAKTSLAPIPAFTLGIMCNALVCLTVWMCFSARTTIDRVFTIIPPITALLRRVLSTALRTSTLSAGFVYQGGAPDAFWASIGKSPADFRLTWKFSHLLPVTIGNVRGSIMVVPIIGLSICASRTNNRVKCDSKEGV